eukprot:838103-Rhodomonas_salina.2
MTTRPSRGPSPPQRRSGRRAHTHARYTYNLACIPYKTFLLRREIKHQNPQSPYSLNREFGKLGLISQSGILRSYGPYHAQCYGWDSTSFWSEIWRDATRRENTRNEPTEALREPTDSSALPRQVPLIPGGDAASAMFMHLSGVEIYGNPPPNRQILDRSCCSVGFALFLFRFAPTSADIRCLGPRWCESTWFGSGRL